MHSLPDSLLCYCRCLGLWPPSISHLSEASPTPPCHFAARILACLTLRASDPFALALAWKSFADELSEKRLEGAKSPCPSWPFSRRFPGRNFLPELCRWGPSRNCPSPSSALCPLLYRTEHFSRRRKGRKCAEKREGRGLATKGGKKGKKDAWKKVSFWGCKTSF